MSKAASKNDMTIWVGSEISYQEYLGTQNTIEMLQASQEPLILQARSEYEDDPTENHLVTKQGAITIININGSISNRPNDWLTKYLQITTYNLIRDALISAAEDLYCEAVVLNIASPGGAVAGLDDVAKLVPLVDSIKPVYAYGSGNMTSAAYWLASGAREIYAGVTSVVGSIGIMAKHREISKLLAEEGVTDTNIRGGRYKALAQDNEPLSMEAKQLMQSQVDYLYGIFLDHVSAQLGKSSTSVHELAADGREFIGLQAVSVGLLDGVMTYDEFMGYISQKVLDNSKASSNTASKSNRTMDNGDRIMSGKTLTAQEVAALAAGGTTIAAAGTETQAAATTDTGAANAETQTAATTTTEQTPEEKAAAEAKANADAVAAANAEAAGGTQLVAYLKEQLKDSQTALATANSELTTLRATGQDPNLKALTEIALAACSNMSIALGGSALEATLTPTQIVAKHAELKPLFGAKFKANGVATVDAAVTESELTGKTSTIDPMHLQRVQAAGGRPATKKP